MKLISVLFPFTFVLFGSGVQAKSLVEGIKNERETHPDEIPSQESLFENARYPLGYAEPNGYSKIEPLYDTSNYRTEILKRSLRNQNSRQTGIIYGGGKPIGILQPYEESFKFMPFKEDRFYSLVGGRSSLDHQEPYLNMMYPISRFARSEEAARMAEAEAAKAEFLDKHYPSMLVDFKIHNKLHPSSFSAKTAPNFNLKREGTMHKNANDNEDEKKKKKRENLTQKTPTQKLHKRDNQHVVKRESVPNKKLESSSTLQKREEKKTFTKREEKLKSQTKRQAVSSRPGGNLKKMKKRQNKLTDSQFEILKNSIAKRNAKGQMRFIEEDLKGLLSDMGLIEDDLQENAEEMEERKREVVQDEDLEDGFDTAIQKDTEAPSVNEKRKRESDENKEVINDDRVMKKRSENMREDRERKNIQKREDDKVEKLEEKSQPKVYMKMEELDEGKRDTSVESQNKKREDDLQNSPTNVPLIETSNSDSKKRTLNDNPNKRSPHEARDKGKRFIEVSFSTKDDKEPVGVDGGSNDCPKPSVIPNKREVGVEKTARTKLETKEEKGKVSEEAAAITTETYEQYEQRVAREIKEKIKMLKDEVKRELGAFESDQDEEDDQESIGETQRKKRFIVNTLMDEESQNIDPNENLENSELEPHVRRRRFLSTDSFDSPLVLRNRFDFVPNGLFGERGPSFSNARSYSKSDVTRKMKGNDYNTFMSGRTGMRSFHWNEPSYIKSQRQTFDPDYHSSRRNLRNDASQTSNRDGESEGWNSAVQSDPNAISDMSRKTADIEKELRQLEGNEEHAPKKIQNNQNQKYFYYYMGNNDDKPVFPKNQRARSNANYQRRFQNKYYTPINRGQIQRTFQRRPYGRRRKKHANLMIPGIGQQDAFVSNVVRRNSTFTKNRNANDEVERLRNLDGNGTYSRFWSGVKRKIDRLATEKGKNFSATGNELPVRNGGVSQNSLLADFKNEESGIVNDNTEDPEENSLDQKQRYWSSYMSSFPSVSEEDRNKGRKPLSLQENSNFPEFTQERIFEPPELKNGKRSDSDFSIGNNDWEETNEYGEGFEIESSTLSNIETKESKRLDDFLNTEPPESTKIVPIAATPTKPNIFSQKKFDLSDFVMDKDNFLVRNESLPLADWKRRKRDLRAEFRSDERRKRSWYWPTLSFLHNNAPQVADDLDLEQNVSPLKRSSNKSSFSNVNEEGEEGADFDHSDEDNYKRKKRGANFRRIYPAGRYMYYYPSRNSRSNHLPLSRNRRYVQRQFMEPQQQLLTEISDAEIFGALPQSYAGELTRYKRVKRADKGADKT